MTSIEHAQRLIERLNSAQPNLTQLRAIAKEVGKNQEVALYLWTHGATNARLLSLLIVDMKTISPPTIDRMIEDIASAAEQDQRQLSDWLLSNVIVKKSALRQDVAHWRTHPSPLKQRMFWSVQARTINAAQHDHNLALVDALETGMADAEGMVQEPMNWCAAQIGIEDERLRERCIQLGERLQLYRDYPVSKGCTSPYLPLWITTVVGKQAVEADQHA